MLLVPIFAKNDALIPAISRSPYCFNQI